MLFPREIINAKVSKVINIRPVSSPDQIFTEPPHRQGTATREKKFGLGTKAKITPTTDYAASLRGGILCHSEQMLHHC